MLSSLVFVWLLLLVVLFVRSSWLLISIIVIEIIGFVLLFFLCVSFSCDILLLSLFSIFVIEGVIAITGFISLVSFSGSDYLSSSSALNF